MTYLYIFFIFLKISIFAFGGGAVAIPLIEHQVVQISNWMTQKEFLDILSLVQVVPGNLSANMALFIGFNRAGFLGGLSALFGFSAIALLLVGFLSHLLYRWRHNTYHKALFFGIVPATMACIFYACIIIAKSSFMNNETHTNFPIITILCFCLVSQFLLKFPSILTLILGTCLGVYLL